MLNTRNPSFLPLTLILSPLLAFVLSCARPDPIPVAAEAVEASASELRTENIRAHVRFLADDLLEGRAPGTRGGDLAALYLRTQFELMGLKPVVEDSYYQMVPLVGLTPDRDMTLELRFDEGEVLRLSYPDQFVAWAGVEEEVARLEGKELVFVGYGITAPELDWNDFKDVDLSDRVPLILVNDPPSEDPDFFGGRALTYYGRWTYKLEEAARRGAAGALLVHTDELAGYPWSVVAGSWSGEQFTLPRVEEKSTRVEGWVGDEIAERLFRAAGFSLEEALQRAARSDFQPVPLDTRVSITVRSDLRRIESPNVLGLVEGTDPRLRDEVLVVTAHYDHLGIGREVDGDDIYNGALDNASGTSGLLEMARAMRNHRQGLRRSILFAAVTAEEQGLLGSRYYAENPFVPLARTAAALNLDSINVWGRTENIIAMGADRSTIIESVEEVARRMELELSPDPFPEQGYFFRSDQFSFVRAGVPAVYLNMGLRFIGQPEGWGEQLMQEYRVRHYHQPSDRFDPDWSFEGSVQMVEFALRTAYDLANRDEMPLWNPGDPFEAIRKETSDRGRPSDR